jgi:hypothetical protein
MNQDTVNLVERPFQEVVDDLLTAVVGGVVNEPILFDVKADLYKLSEPAGDVRSIHGTLDDGSPDGVRHAFLKNTDFLFSEGDNAVVWEGGDKPKDDTTFYVDYFRRESRSPLSDINVGSVTRTLSEAIGREIATVYQQINLAYLAGFIDTATGSSLDLVVSILGITRKTSEFATGLVTFFRETAVRGVIAIPQGLPLSTTKGEVFFETTQPRILQEGQSRIDAPIRAGEAFKGELGIVPAGAITEMVQPLAGIARITNLDPTIRAAEDETDEELRLRARAVLRALGKATLAALDRVIREGRGTPVEFWDPNSPPERRTDPGTVAILVQAEPERFPSLRAAVEETRAAGVVATLVARYVFFKLRVAAKVTPGLTAAGKEKVKEEMLAALQEYVDGLSSGEPADGATLKEKLKGVDDVSNPVFREVLVWRSDIGRPSADLLLDSLVGAAAATPAGGTAALKDALALILAGAPPTAPTGARIADRSLLESASGGPATDEDVENAEFKIAATVAGEPWWVVLDMQPSDILLEEG